MKRSPSPTTDKIKSFRKRENFSEHKKYKLSSKPEHNNPELFGNMMIRNSYMHNRYSPELDNSNSFKFFKYLNTKTPVDENLRSISLSIIKKGRKKFKFQK